MHKLIIFDIDGTLLDTEVAVLKGLQKCLKVYHNIDINLKDLTFAIGMAMNTILQSKVLE
ncbi:HAD hydrolase-like protein [Intestinibacter sp.]